MHVGARKPAMFKTLREMESELKRRLLDTDMGTGLLSRAKRTTLSRKGIRYKTTYSHPPTLMASIRQDWICCLR